MALVTIDVWLQKAGHHQHVWVKIVQDQNCSSRLNRAAAVTA
jgi:hypothetical protein